MYIINKNWSFISSKTFTSPAYIITIENSIYITGSSNLWKLDQNLNNLIQCNATGTVNYRGLYFNSTNRFFYVALYGTTVRKSESK